MTLIVDIFDAKIISEYHCIGASSVLSVCKFPTHLLFFRGREPAAAEEALERPLRRIDSAVLLKRMDKDERVQSKRCDKLERAAFRWDLTRKCSANPESVPIR